MWLNLVYSHMHITHGHSSKGLMWHWDSKSIPESPGHRAITLTSRLPRLVIHHVYKFCDMMTGRD